MCLVWTEKPYPICERSRGDCGGACFSLVPFTAKAKTAGPTCPLSPVSPLNFKTPSNKRSTKNGLMSQTGRIKNVFGWNLATGLKYHIAFYNLQILLENTNEETKQRRFAPISGTMFTCDSRPNFPQRSSRPLPHDLYRPYQHPSTAYIPDPTFVP